MVLGCHGMEPELSNVRDPFSFVPAGVTSLTLHHCCDLRDEVGNTTPSQCFAAEQDFKYEEDKENKTTDHENTSERDAKECSAFGADTLGDGILFGWNVWRALVYQLLPTWSHPRGTNSIGCGGQRETSITKTLNMLYQRQSTNLGRKPEETITTTI